MEVHFTADVQAKLEQLARDTGRLSVGAIADVTTLRADHPTLAGKTGDQILDAWIFSAGGEAVDRVWSAGRKVVADGRHVSRDRVASKFKAAMMSLSER